MSKQQRDSLHSMMVSSPLEIGGDIVKQRGILNGMLTSHPLADDVIVSAITLGGVPALSVDIDGHESDGTILWFHGGVFAMGSAGSSVGLASDLGRRAHMRVVTVDYRLAPEFPYPAGPDDAVAAYRGLLESEGDVTRIAIAGESAGGNLVLSTLIAIRDAGLPMPFAGLVMSPWVDLAVTGHSADTKAGIDPALTVAGLRVRAADYLGELSPGSPLVSPIYADLTGLPPLLIQAGSNEILMDDATRLAAKAAEGNVAVILDIVPEVPHVFQAFAAIIEEGDQAMDRAASFLARRTQSPAR